MELEQLKPGQRIRVIQTIDRRDVDWHAEVVGKVHSVAQEKTGSWYAHSKDARYWLWRIRLQKDDGELTTLNLDQRSRIELLEDASK